MFQDFSGTTWCFNYNGKYLVSEFGTIIECKKGRYLKPTDRQRSLQTSKKVSEYRSGHVHRIVYEIYIGIIPKGFCVRYVDGNYLNTHYSNLLASSAGSFYGFGVNDTDLVLTRREFVEGKKKIVWRCPYYADWSGMIQRCYDISKLAGDNKSYVGSTICNDWKYFSNFIKWVDSQPNRDWINCALDKDILFEGNKHYSPDTCLYVSESLNGFILNCAGRRGNCLLGAHYHKRLKKNPYSASCHSPFNIGKGFLGYYPTEIEAHKAWQAKKHEYACQLADLQDDPRVADALRQRYAPDKDWTTS